MKRILFFLLAAVMLSCNTAPKQQQESSKPEDTAERVEEAQKEVKEKVDLPPQPKEFSWFFMMCDYTGTYDSIQYSEEELENTLKWLINGEGTVKPFSIFDPADLQRVDKEAVEEEFDQTLQNLKTLGFVNTPYFKELKESRINEVEQLKLLSLMQIESFSNPGILQDDAYSKDDCREYTNALIAGGDELLAMRKKMAEQSRGEGNSSAWERYIEETQSDNELELARIHVSTFGWWNCVNTSIERVDMHQAHETEFLRFFENVTMECEEP